MFQNITPAEALKLVKIRKDLVILDVRTREEFQKKHFPHALNIDFYVDHFEERLGELDRNKIYLIHCHSGGRSTKTVLLMEKMGFKEGFNVKGIVFE